MMNLRQKRFLGVIFFGAATLSILSPATVLADDPSVKLGRGFSNVVFCWGEALRALEKSSQEKGVVQGSMIGAVRAPLWSITRLGAGLYEIVTFPFPVPKEYKPVLYPEFVFNDYGE